MAHLFVNGIRTDVMEALKSIKAPVLRRPGGCFADTYQRMDAIRETANRKTIVNTNRGGVKANTVTGRVLTGKPTDYNDFATPAVVKPAAPAAALTEDGFAAVLPACTVAAFTEVPA